MDNYEIADLIDKGADYLQEYGHCKGRLQQDNGSVCAVGALRGALRDWKTNFHSLPPLVKATQAIGVQVDAPIDTLGLYNIAFWNDSSETTTEDVINAFRKTAIRLREVVE